MQIRRREERGHFDHGWLDTYHSFSFGEYRDPDHRQFRSLRVMNEDRIQGGHGFGMHPHQDMEIVTYVLEGALEHKDSMGNGSVLKAGMIQRMSAGTGILHSEFNHSSTETVHLYQIWLLPAAKGIEPSYEEASFPEHRKEGRWLLVASPDGREDSVHIHQEASVYLARLNENQELIYEIAPKRHAWLQILRGEVEINDKRLRTADGAAVSTEARLEIKSSSRSEVLLFDLS